jgi:hypothetical protein
LHIAATSTSSSTSSSTSLHIDAKFILSLA